MRHPENSSRKVSHSINWTSANGEAKKHKFEENQKKNPNEEKSKYDNLVYLSTLKVFRIGAANT